MNSGIAMNRRRIDWADIAKAIGILCMIVGHVYPVGSVMRNLIFSFHMPLFFILSGYTSKRVNTAADLWKNTRKDFVRLLIPCLAASTLYLLQRYAATLIGMNDEGFMETIGSLPGRFFWAYGSATEYADSLGVFWFVVVLFWARFLYSAVQIIFPGGYNGFIYLFMALAGVLTGERYWLPQSIDLAFVAVLFLWTGHLCRQYREVLKKYILPLGLTAFLVWMLCFQNGIYIGMSTRDYPYGVVCIAEAIAGSACVILLSKAIESSRFRKVLTSIGGNTMLILCIHKLDCFSIWGGYSKQTICWHHVSA